MDICQHHLYMASSEAPTLLPRGAHGVAKWGKFKEQLGRELLSLSKIRDGSTLRPLRPQRTAVFDFRFLSRYALQLFLEGRRSTQTHPVSSTEVMS